MKYVVLFIICATILFTLIPQSYAELYYNEKYSFSVDIPSGWIVDDLGVERDGVFVCDGKVDAAHEFQLWKTCIRIDYYPDYGEKYSDDQEKQLQLDDLMNQCRTATFAEHEYKCTNFKLVEQMPAGITVDGYPRITTIHTETYDLPGFAPQDQVDVTTYVYVGNDVWGISSQSDWDVWSEHKSKIFHLINSFHYPAAPPATSTDGGGCLIATAAFGSEMAPQVQLLREIRDNTVLQTESGTSFMAGFNQFYYSFSPYIADYERENPAFKETVKLALTPLLTSLTLLQYVDIDSESEMLGYGIGVILLNIGMYFVAPAVLIMAVRKRI